MTLLTAPSTMLRWASSLVLGYPGRTEPNSGQKDSGFTDGEAPAAAVHNWLFGVAGDWVAYLAQQAARSALLDALNVFTAAPLTVDVNDASLSLLGTTKSPANDPHGGNLWKHILGPFPLAGLGAEVHMYAGVEASASDTTTVGAFCIAVNAAWDPAAAKWHYLSANSEPMALILTARGIRLSQQPMAHAAWSTWPTNSRISAAPTGALELAGEYSYLPLPTRHRTLSLHHFQVAVGSWSINLAGGVQAANAADECLFALDVPHGCTVKFYVLHTQTTSAPNVLQVYQRRKTDWPSGLTAPAQTVAQDIASATMLYTGPSSAGTDNFITGQLSVDNADCSYDLSFQAGHAGDHIDAVWLEFVDPGPRNF